MVDNVRKYKFGYNDSMVKQLQKRGALKDAAFLLPYLKPCIKLLDCGCGPGSITSDLAKILSDGQVVAIDIDDESLKIAESTARENNLSNISFQKASILDLPFDNNSFDVVFTRATLYHLQDAKKAIKEMLRVAKTGGIIAACEPDIGGMLYYPENRFIKEAQKVRTDIITKDGADLMIGRKLRSLFVEIGCKKAIAFSTSEPKGELESLQAITEYLASEFTDTPFGKELVDKKIVSEKEIKVYQQAYRDFAKNPGAFMMFTWCQAIGYK